MTELPKVGCTLLMGSRRAAVRTQTGPARGLHRPADTLPDQAWLFLFSRDFSKVANEGKV